MRLGLIEVSGIRKVVFYSKTEWNREVTESGKLLMRRSDGKKVMNYEEMVEKLQKIPYESYRDMWVEGETINVKRLDKSKMITTKFDEDGNMMAKDPDGRWRDLI